tara:strand:+ start:1496 stop:2092 length:597 start_codon:yes stop_codon:yes gene_type:complete
MPRKPTEKAVEHRITLGDFERAAITKALTLQQENQRLDAVTHTLNAVGIAIGGGGAMLAGLAFLKWKGAEIYDTIKDKTMGALDDVADAFLPKTPVQFRRQAQELANRRATLDAEINRTCTHDSPDYNAAACNLAHDAKDVYFDDLEAFRAQVRAAKIEEDSFYWRFIFQGLGDVDPEHGTGDGSETAWWEYFLNFSL